MTDGKAGKTSMVKSKDDLEASPGAERARRNQDFVPQPGLP